MTTADPARGPIPLRPMNLGDLLDGAVRLFVANWRALLLAVGVVVVPLQLLAAFLQREQLRFGFFQMISDPTAFDRLQGSPFGTGQTAALVAILLISLLILPFAAGAVCMIVGWSYLRQPVDWRAALRAAGGRFGSLLSAAILVRFVEFLLVAPAIAMFVAGVVTGSAGLVGIGFLLLLAGIIGVVIVASLYVAVVPAVVTEGIGAVAAMRRSWRLRRPRLAATVGAVMVSGLLASIAGAIVSFVPSVLGQGFGGRLAWMLVGIGGTLGQLVQIPFVAIVATLLYFDGRIRQEGFDLQLMATDLDR